MANDRIDNDWMSSDDDNGDMLPKRKPKEAVDSDVEEGELSSGDGDDGDDDESNLEKLFKSKEERRRLLGMTEKEREEEIFRRSMEVSDLRSRQRVVRRLREEQKSRGTAGKTSGDTSRPKNKKRSLAEVFGHCSDGEGDRGDDRDRESIFSSSSSGDSGDCLESSSLRLPAAKKAKVSPLAVNPRQKALEDQKSSTNAMLSQLHENRKQKKERLEKLNKGKADAVKKSIFESDQSDDEKKINVDRLSIISSSSSEQMGEPKDEFEDKFVEEMEDLSKIRLNRVKMESWVHMPFFKSLVKGCFVRVNIGEGPDVIPVYRIAEIIEVVETVKIYDLGKTRTNVGVRLRIGKSVTMFRLPFVSNQNFLQAEFDSWRRRVITDGFPLPKLSFIEEKYAELKKYSNFSISNEETMKQVLMSKQRFQKGPVNIALRKAELTRLKLGAENDGDLLKANKFQDEIDELNMKAEKLERKRTEGIKNISYINQRNREITMEHVEKAIELEMAEKLEWDKIGGDPFVREATKPVLNYKKKKQERLEKEAEEMKKKKQQEENVVTVNGGGPAGGAVDCGGAVGSNNQSTRQSGDSRATEGADCAPSSSSSSSANNNNDMSKINIHNIHDFELHLDINLDNNNSTKTASVTAGGDGDDMSLSSGIGGLSGYLPSISLSTAVPTITTANSGSSSRRVLNLQDYKKRKGLI